MPPLISPQQKLFLHVLFSYHGNFVTSPHFDFMVHSSHYELFLDVLLGFLHKVKKHYSHCLFHPWFLYTASKFYSHTANIYNHYKMFLKNKLHAGRIFLCATSVSSSQGIARTYKNILFGYHGNFMVLSVIYLESNKHLIT